MKLARIIRHPNGSETFDVMNLGFLLFGLLLLGGGLLRLLGHGFLGMVLIVSAFLVFFVLGCIHDSDHDRLVVKRAKEERAGKKGEGHHDNKPQGLESWEDIRDHYTCEELKTYIRENKEKVEAHFAEFFRQGYDGITGEGLGLVEDLLCVLGYPNGAKITSYMFECIP